MERRIGRLDIPYGKGHCLIQNVDDDEGAAHLNELAKLAEKDPEFYKYLQENDKELLDFDPNAMEEDEEDGGGDEEDNEDEDEVESVPVLTKNILQKWQKAILEVRCAIHGYQTFILIMN